MKKYSLETLLDYLFKDLLFSSRVLVMGDWTWETKDIQPGSRHTITFYLERLTKKDIRQIEKLNGTNLLEDVTIETRALPISVYRELLKKSTLQSEIRLNAILRDDFMGFEWYLRSDQVKTLLDYILYQIDLPQRCAVIVYNCFPGDRGVRSFEKIELLFVFEEEKKKWLREIKKLEKLELPEYVGANLHLMDIEAYEKFLSGELAYFDEETKERAIVLYDAFHRKRLNAPFMRKKIK